MKYVFKYNKDFETTPLDPKGLQTSYPERIYVEHGACGYTGERQLIINLGTNAKGLAARRIREMLKKMEK